MKKTACFTGHRILSEPARQLFDRLYPILEKLVKDQGITDFYAGGAVGFDTVAEKCVLRLRDQRKMIIEKAESKLSEESLPADCIRSFNRKKKVYGL